MMAGDFFASDLDGTFFDNQREYDVDRFKTLVQIINSQDNHFVLATGRDLIMLEKSFAPVWGQVDIVANNGAVVIAANGTVLQEAVIPIIIMEKVMQVISKMHLEKGVIFVGLNHKFMLRKHRNLNHQKNTFQREDQVSYFVEQVNEIHDRIVKLTFGVETQAVPALIELIQNQVGSSVYVTTSGYGSIDVIAATVNKAQGLQILAQYYQQDQPWIMAFGDGLNDLEMLKIAQMPYAMSNGDPVIVEQFPPAMADNQHSGVIKTIEKYLQKKQTNK